MPEPTETQAFLGFKRYLGLERWHHGRSHLKINVCRCYLYERGGGLSSEDFRHDLRLSARESDNDTQAARAMSLWLKRPICRFFVADEGRRDALIFFIRATTISRRRRQPRQYHPP